MQKNLMNSLTRRQRGAQLVESVLVIVLIMVVSLVAVRTFGRRVYGLLGAATFGVSELAPNCKCQFVLGDASYGSNGLVLEDLNCHCA